MRNIHIILIFIALCLGGAALNAQTVTLKADTVSIPCASTDTVSVPVRVSDFTQIIGMQFTIKWLPANLQFQSVSAVNPAFSSGSNTFDVQPGTVSQGRMTYVWSDLSPVTVPSNTVVFRLIFKRLGGPQTAVAFDTSATAQTPLSILDANVEELPFAVLHGAVKPLDAVGPTITCPADVTLSASGPFAVPNIAPTAADACGVDGIGWSSTGATTASFPTDSDASGAVFNIGASQVTYQVLDFGGNTATCVFNINLEQTAGPADDTLTIVAGSAAPNCGQQFFVDISVLNFDSIGGVQFSLDWDESLMQFESLSNFNNSINVTAGNFSLLYTAQGNLSFYWNTDNFSAGNSLNDGTVLFRINFTNLGGATASSTMGFGDFPTPPDAADPQANAIGLKFKVGQVDVLDTTPPTLVCPGNQSADAEPNGTATFTNLAPTMLTDNCAGNLPLSYVQSAPTSGSGQGNANGVYQAGTTTVTYTTTDAEGNTATCLFTVTVNAGLLPGVALDSIENPCTDSLVSFAVRVSNFADVIGMGFVIRWDPAVLQLPIGSPGPPTFLSGVYPGMGTTYGDFPNYNLLAPGGNLFYTAAISSTPDWPNIPDGDTVFVLTFKVLNPNATTAVTFEQPIDATNGAFQTIVLNTSNGLFTSADTDNPVVTCPGSGNIIVPAQQNCQAVYNIPNATATDACGTVASITNDAPVNNTYPAGPTVVTFTATDAAGNVGTCSRTVFVNANTALQFNNCPTAPIVIETDPAGTDCSAAISYPTVTATNPCIANANFIYSYNIPSGTVLPVGDHAVVATATQIGNGGGTVTCNIQIQVVDATPPTLVCPPDQTISTSGEDCFVANPLLLTPTASDNCDASITDIYIDPDLIDTLAIGTHDLIYLAADLAGNLGACSYQVTVLDGVAPTLKCPDDISLETAVEDCGNLATWDPPLVNDNCTDVADLLVTNDAPLDSFFVTGPTSVTYTVTDASGNTATCSFVVFVSENVPPTLSPCPNSIFVTLPITECDTTISWIEPQASDLCGVDTLIQSHHPGDVFPSGSTTVTYTAIDLAGNETTCEFEVVASDQVAPVFLTFPNDTIVLNASPCGAILNLPEPTVEDNCDPNPTITYAGSLQDTFPVGITRIEIKVEDASGNLTIDTLVIEVKSLATKSFLSSTIPPNQMLMVQGCEGVATWTIPSVTGFCETPTITANYASGDTFPIGVTTVIFTASEPNSSPITASFTITVLEKTPPTLDCPTAVVVSAAGVVVDDPGNLVASVTTLGGCDSVTLVLNNPAATDNCPDPVLVVQSDGVSGDGGTFSPGTYNLTYQATDKSGNVASCVVQVTVQGFDALVPVVSPNPGCEGEQVTLTVPTVPGATYTWTGPQQSYPNEPTITILSLSAGNTGEYSVTASLNGCVTEPQTVEVLMATQPDAVNDANFTIGLGETLDSINVLLNDVFTLASDINLTLKSPLDGLTLDEESNLFTYTSGTQGGVVSFIYEICSEACSELCDMATVTITVRDNKCDFVPNIFTPNGDQANDLLVIPCLESGLYPNNTLVIYNQWGDKVFEADGYTNNWKGTLNNDDGKPLPDGVYYYIFQPDSNSATVKGFVHIFR